MRIGEKPHLTNLESVFIGGDGGLARQSDVGAYEHRFLLRRHEL